MKPQAKQPAARPCFSNGLRRQLPAQSIQYITTRCRTKIFAILKSLLYLCTAFERRIELWCNGNTSDLVLKFWVRVPIAPTKMRINEFLFIRIYSFRSNLTDLPAEEVKAPEIIRPSGTLRTTSTFSMNRRRSTA